MGGLQNEDGSNSRCSEDEITLAADGKREREVGGKATGWEIQQGRAESKEKEKIWKMERGSKRNRAQRGHKHSPEI